MSYQTCTDPSCKGFRKPLWPEVPICPKCGRKSQLLEPNADN